MEQFALSFVPERRILSLRELSDAIRGALEGNFSNIWISGEISGVKLVPSGHCYFTLKDADAQIKCVCWKLSYWRLRFKPKDGVQALVRGRVDIYEQRSEYQFVVEALEPRGEGALRIAFEQLRRKLIAEGLFETSRKRRLPRFPMRVGVIASPKGAVIQDVLEILSRRFPGIHIRLFPARVQGPGSAEDVCRGLEYFGRSAWPQVIVLARGGGSIEDLWTFNEETVARAVAASPIPVVSAIGHETDVTIADFVSDVRAPTPSAAAEMIICTRQELLDRIEGCRVHAARAIRYRLAILARRLHERGSDRAQNLVRRALARRVQRVDEAEQRLRYFDLRPRLRRDRERWTSLDARAVLAMRLQLAGFGRRLERISERLGQLDPRLVLSRGYAIVLNGSDKIVRHAADAPPESEVTILLAKEALRARITAAPTEE